MLILTEFYLYNPYTWFRSPILARKYGKYYWGSGIHETKCNNKVLSYLCHSLHIRSWRSDLHHHLWTFGYYEGRTTFCCSSRRFQAARRQDLPIIVQLARRKTRWEEARLNFDVENRLLHTTYFKKYVYVSTFQIVLHDSFLAAKLYWISRFSLVPSNLIK